MAKKKINQTKKIITSLSLGFICTFLFSVLTHSFAPIRTVKERVAGDYYELEQYSCYLIPGRIHFVNDFNQPPFGLHVFNLHGNLILYITLTLSAIIYLIKTINFKITDKTKDKK